MSDYKICWKKKLSILSGISRSSHLSCEWLNLLITLGLIILNPIPASAKWRVGMGFGFGGTGITKEVALPTGDRTTVQRSEGIGTMQFFAETLWTDTRVIGIEHTRGFRLGPFSSGVGFTSATLRWHYLGPAPDVNKPSNSSTLFVKRWSPYVGPMIGLASGTIKREGDQIDNVSSSGVHIGIKNGVDYLLNPSLGMRIEISASQTIFAAATRPASMTQFSLWYGLFVPF